MTVGFALWTLGDFRSATDFARPLASFSISDISATLRYLTRTYVVSRCRASSICQTGRR
jgi:hypothetical protein